MWKLTGQIGVRFEFHRSIALVNHSIAPGGRVARALGVGETLGPFANAPSALRSRRHWQTRRRARGQTHSATSRTWNGIRDRLAAFTRVVAYDRPGLGGPGMCARSRDARTIGQSVSTPRCSPGSTRKAPRGQSRRHGGEKTETQTTADGALARAGADGTGPASDGGAARHASFLGKQLLASYLAVLKSAPRATVKCKADCRPSSLGVTAF